MKVKNAYKALIILMFITITISGYEFLTALKNFNPNGTIFDFCSGAVEYIPYFMIFLLALFLVLPISLLLFKENNIQLKSAILDKKHLFKDILYGIIINHSMFISRAGITHNIKQINNTFWYKS